jgi:ABC-type multidrug transport system fused ATPase/permease subunit
VCNFRKIYLLIPHDYRKRVIFLQVIFFITAVFQVAGIASVAPFIAIISNPGVISSNNILSSIFDYFQFQSNKDFLIFSAFSIAFLIAISNVIAAFSTWYLYRFSVAVGGKLQTTLYEKYINSQYDFFSQNNSSRLISNITQELPRFIYMVFQPALNLIAQSLIALLILIGLIVVDPLLALLSFFVIGGIYFFIYWTVIVKMQESGETVTLINKEKLQILNESLCGVKEVKLLNVEPWYIERLNAATLKGLNANAFISVAGDLPRFVVETFVFIAILALAIYLFATQGASGGAITTLSFYAMAGYKILPAIQSIYRSISMIKANFSVVDNIYDDMLPDPATQTFPDRTKSRDFGSLDGDIEFVNVSYSYPKSSKPALTNVNCVIRKDAFNAFVGGSGAGKSTMADLLLGLLIPSSGEIRSGSIKFSSDNVRAWQKRIGYVPQSIFLVDDTVRNNIAFGIPPEAVIEENIIKAAQMAQLGKVFGDLKTGLETTVGENGSKLSGGQIQRIGIARALYKDPDILIFDEATSALDTITEQQVIDSIHAISAHKTVVMIAHRLSTIMDAKNIVMFKDGRVVSQGRYDELYHSNVEFKSLVDAGQRRSVT